MAPSRRPQRAALRYIYATYRTQIWGPFGFKDAFNPSEKWFATDYLGIDQGPIVLMIENYRSGRIWNIFMQHPNVQRGLALAGFLPVVEANNRHPTIDLASQTPPPETPPAHVDPALQPSPPEAQSAAQRS